MIIVVLTHIKIDFNLLMAELKGYYCYIDLNNEGHPHVSLLPYCVNQNIDTLV
jgi:hypothetical protein